MVAVRFNKLTVVVIVSLQVDLQWRRSRFQPTDPADWLPLELLKGRMHQFDGQHDGLVSELTMTQLSVQNCVRPDQFRSNMSSCVALDIQVWG